MGTNNSLLHAFTGTHSEAPKERRVRCTLSCEKNKVLVDLEYPDDLVL